MTQSDLTVMVLAAGKSTRFKSRVPKVLHPLGERAIIAHSLDLAAQLTTEPAVLVVGPETEEDLRAWGKDRVRYVVQHDRRGTGHAVQQAQPLLQGSTRRVLVLYGDMPLLRAETLRALSHQQRVTGAAIALLTVIRPEPQGFGRILRDAQGAVQCVVEEPEATPEQLAIRELNAGIYVFDADFLWATLPRLVPSAEKGELYLTDMVGLATGAGLQVASTTVEDETEVIGINTRVDYALAQEVLRERIASHWMLSGVTIIDPRTTHIGEAVRIGQDTVIHPNTYLRGATIIGSECTIGPNTIIESSEIGEGCTVLASVLEYAVMEPHSDIGPFSHLRKGARICSGTHVGNFAELKNSTLGPHSHMGHFSYLGDTTTGEHVNIGAGTITCNFDGVQKHRTTIGDHVFVGSDSLLVAPVELGSGCKTGAGSVVTHDVPPNALAYGVPARVRKQVEPPEDEPPTPPENAPEA